MINNNKIKTILIKFSLQNPAIRDRHWQQLVSATKVSFVMSEDTSLADLVCKKGLIPLHLKDLLIFSFDYSFH